MCDSGFLWTEDESHVFQLLTPMYNCARIKLTAPRDGCKLWSMRLIIPPGGSHDQEQDSEYDTRISSPRQIDSRHRDPAWNSQEYGAQIPAPPRAVRDASPATQSSFQVRSVQGPGQEVDPGRSLLQLRGDVAPEAFDGLHRKLECTQSLCASPASTSSGTRPGGALVIRSRASKSSSSGASSSMSRRESPARSTGCMLDIIRESDKR